MPLPSLPNCNDFLVLLSFGITPPTATAVVSGCHCSLAIPDGGDAKTPKAPNSASSLLRGASEVVAAMAEEDTSFTRVTKATAASAAADGEEAATSV